MGRSTILLCALANLALAACSHFDDGERFSAQPPIRHLGESNPRSFGTANKPDKAIAEKDGPAMLASIDLPQLIVAYANTTTPGLNPAHPLEDAISRFDRAVAPKVEASTDSQDSSAGTAQVKQTAPPGQQSNPVNAPSDAPTGSGTRPTANAHLPPGKSMSAQEASNYRNAIVSLVLMASDQNCDLYLTKVRANQVTMRASFSALATIFSGIASITTPESSAHVLSALGAASSGVGGNLNDAMFTGKAVDLIATAVRGDRAKVRASLELRMKNDYWDWPLSQAMSEVATYHGRCNMMSGLGALQQVVTKDTNSSEANLAEKRDPKATGTPSPEVTTPEPPSEPQGTAKTEG